MGIFHYFNLFLGKTEKGLSSSRYCACSNLKKKEANSKAEYDKSFYTHNTTQEEVNINQSQHNKTKRGNQMGRMQLIMQTDFG